MVKSLPNAKLQLPLMTEKFEYVSLEKRFRRLRKVPAVFLLERNLELRIGSDPKDPTTGRSLGQ